MKVSVLPPAGTPTELARYLRTLAEANNARINEYQDIVVDTSSYGLILKSPNGHYWRVTVGDTGTLSTTDLGTTLP